MLDFTQLEALIAESNYSEAEKVNDSILKATKKKNDIPYAVYYFDIGEGLPNNKEELSDYSDQIIGRYYFDGEKHLQWNTYLYFIRDADLIDSSKGRDIKRIIELDRRYARKRVVTTEGLRLAVSPPLSPAVMKPAKVILTTWMELLAANNLIDSIFTEADLPTRMKFIEESETKSIEIDSKIVPIQDVEIPQKIGSLELAEYRDYPKQRHFEFSLVNLITGVNGTGKTSLLEAIELFYCGYNARNPKELIPYMIKTKLENDIEEIADNNRSMSVFRDRNLAWYGQYEIKSKNLCQSFKLFNFLDTDAAVSLSTSESNIEDDLSKLLIGPAASKIWQNIERVNDKVATRIRELHGELRPIEDETRLINDRINVIKTIPDELSSVQLRLGEILNRNSWSLRAFNEEDPVSEIIGFVSELSSIVESLIDLTSIQPISISSMEEYSLQEANKLDIAKKDLTTIQKLMDKEIKTKQEVDKQKESSKTATRIMILVESGIVELSKEIEVQKELITDFYKLMSGYEEFEFDDFSSDDLEVRINEFHDRILDEIAETENLHKKAEEDYINHSRHKEELDNLIEQLRYYGIKVIESSDESDECPLCHTRFELGKLRTQINKNIGDQKDNIGRDKIQAVKDLDAKLQSLLRLKKKVDWLMNFRDGRKMNVDDSVGSVIEEVVRIKTKLEDAIERRDSLESELISQERQGMTIEELEELTLKMSEYEHPISEMTRETVQLVKQQIEEGLGKLQRDYALLEKDKKNLVARVGKALGKPNSDIQVIFDHINKSENDLKRISELKSKLLRFLNVFPWSEERSFTEFVVELDAVMKVASNMKSELFKQEKIASELSHSNERISELEERKNLLTGRIGRLEIASAVFTEITLNHSHKEAISSALERSRNEIETIFSLIHSPQEFTGLGSSMLTLIRDGDEGEIELSQISTGQREAFALSIFLAKNAELINAPPVILIDDPLAHVDDLNTLSFLDYLRDLVLEEGKQLFFTTANEKLASLFTKKFDFLGDDFQSFELERN